METVELTHPYRVQAYNASHASENKIHSDTVARQYGFAGALVPGAEVYAYMTHLPVRRWGQAWLDRGGAECRFLRPLYDGREAVVTAVETGDRLGLEVRCGDTVCATGSAWLDAGHGGLLDPGQIRNATPPRVRPPADETTLAPGTMLGIAPFRPTAESMAGYLHDVRETHALYASEGLVHPGLMLRLCNWALTQNVVLGPWIHTGSSVRHFAAARVGEALSVRARVTANYERKGHRFVEIDALILADDIVPVAHVAHTAIYRLRQTA